MSAPHQMNDIMLYTYPQQDGKYRLKNTLSLSGMKVGSPNHFSHFTRNIISLWEGV